MARGKGGRLSALANVTNKGGPARSRGVPSGKPSGTSVATGIGGIGGVRGSALNAVGLGMGKTTGVPKANVLPSNTGTFSINNFSKKGKSPAGSSRTGGGAGKKA